MPCSPPTGSPPTRSLRCAPRERSDVVTRALVLRGGTVLGRTGWLSECDVAIANGVVTGVGRNLRADHARTIDVRDHRVVPGLVDVHLHGAGGGMFEEGRE